MTSETSERGFMGKQMKKWLNLKNLQNIKLIQKQNNVIIHR